MLTKHVLYQLSYSSNFCSGNCPNNEIITEKFPFVKPVFEKKINFLGREKSSL